MALKRIEIRSIAGGKSASQYFYSQGQILDSVGIDPDLPVSDAAGDVDACLLIRPTSYAAFSSTPVDANPYWLLTNPKDTKLYAYLNSGKLVSYSSSFGSETTVGTPSSSSGNGAAYYNNFLYLFTNTDVARYGPLNNSPSLASSVWTGATLGSLTALTNTTYPSIRGSGVIPNHPAHVHSDNKLYFGDFKNGFGMIHYIKTTKTTDEGDTNDASAYNVLDLPFGFMPTDIESYGTNLVISAIQTSDSTVNQGKAALFFWDTISASFYNIVWLPDTLVTALLNVNGELYIWSAPGFSKGYRLSTYNGAYGINNRYISSQGSPPLAGAVDSYGSRILWGSHQQIRTTTAASPEYYASVMALGSKNPSTPMGLHSIAKAPVTATATDGYVTALKIVEQDSVAIPKVIMGYRSASAIGIAKRSTTYGTSIFRSQLINVGQKFRVKRIRIPLAQAIATNIVITPTIFVDDFSASFDDTNSGFSVINSTNFTNSERYVVFDVDAVGDLNFCLELRASGSALSTIQFPIRIFIELEGD